MACSDAIARTRAVAGDAPGRRLTAAETTACRSAAEQGSPAASYALGLDLLLSEEFDQAREQFRMAAERGSAEAEYVLGMMVFNEDPARAAEHIERAARKPTAVTRISLSQLASLAERQADPETALAWTYVQDAAGWADAGELAGREAACDPAQRERARRRADAWIRDAGYAERGFPTP